MIRKFGHSALLLAFCCSLAACSGGGSNSRIDYEQAKTLPPLEVPPGLGKPLDSGTDNVPELGASVEQTGGNGSQQVLPVGTGIHIEHDGKDRWLLIDTSADALWPKLREFWKSIGLELKVDKPAEGIMETQWAENRANLPQGYFAKLVRKVLKNAYSAGALDKYRLRLEPVGANRTEVYVTHYGLKEVALEDQSGEVADTAWELRPSDPELADEVMNRLVLYLGGSKQTAKALLQARVADDAPKAHLDGDAVVVDEGFSRAWRLTGLALDRLGMVVEDRNRSAGIYYVSHVDQLKDAGAGKKKGWFSSLFSSDDDKSAAAQEQWQIHLNGDDNATRISVYDSQGKRVAEKTSMPLLKRLQESLK